MIKNERQYRITRTQAERFEQALADLSRRERDQGADPLLRQLQEDAMRSQLSDLREELAEYEAVRSGRVPLPNLTSYMDLPRLIIQRRIAAGLSQKDLADRLGLKEQQIQQYEATDYASASFARLMEIMRVLDVQPEADCPDNGTKLTLRALFDRLKELGFDRKFTASRLIPRQVRAQIDAARAARQDAGMLVLRAADAAGRALGLSPKELMAAGPPRLDTRLALGGARFKVPASASESRLNAYTVYAYHVARLVLDATNHLPRQPVPTDWQRAREGILSAHGGLEFGNVLEYLWDRGIPVLPLSDAGAFHGACWRVDGRNVVVLKQQTRAASRWSYDALHELWHAGEDPERNTFAVIEAGHQDQAHLKLEDEQAANGFAANVLLNGRAEQLAQLCAQEAGGSIPALKQAVVQVSRREGVPLGALANYLAYRLAIEGRNWWGAATVLQTDGVDPLALARSFLLERADFGRLNDVDQMMLMQAVAESEE